ncbi:MAG: VOC family protein [Bacteroidetes bacterium]|nr:VOC family protein [Bacteroidota bacterium]
MQKITPFLWLNCNVDEAAAYYISVFNNSSVISTTPGQDGNVMAVTVNLDGQVLVLFNGGPHFTLNEAFSLSVSCNSQEEIDEKWNTLCEGGTPSRCGWLKDKYGVSWQIVPHHLGSLLFNPDPEKAKRAMQAMMGMGKLIIADLENA